LIFNGHNGVIFYKIKLFSLRLNALDFKHSREYRLRGAVAVSIQTLHTRWR
jgi:hypothetical protein